MRGRSVLLLFLAAGVAWPGEAAAKTVVGYVKRDQPIKTTWVAETLGKAFPNDPDRCAAFGFGQWARVRYATG